MVMGNEVLERPSVRLALLAILTALVAVLTMVISIPVPATQGYINLGDAGVLFAGLLLGPLGGIASGIGSALADVALGYFQYAPITLVVKGLEGAITGLLFFGLRVIRRIEVRAVIAVIVGSIIMLMGYLLAETLMYGFLAAVAELPGNVFQVAFGSIISVIAFISIDKIFHFTSPSLAPKSRSKWTLPMAW